MKRNILLLVILILLLLLVLQTYFAWQRGESSSSSIEQSVAHVALASPGAVAVRPASGQLERMDRSGE